MTDDEVKYDTLTERVFARNSGRAIEQRAEQGWELVSQTELALFRTQLDYRKPKSKHAWLLWGIPAGVVAVGLTILIVVALVSGAGDDSVEAVKPSERPTSSATARPSVESTKSTRAPAEPTVAPAEPVVSTVLDETYAAQHLSLSWEARMQYGGTVHWIMDRITTANADGTFTFKIGATVNSADGGEVNAIIEGDVGGTNEAPVILDSILYTDTGEIIEY